MNYEYICQREGYRLEDLKKENQEIIWHCNHVIESLDGLKAHYSPEPSEDISLHKKLYSSIAQEVLEEATEWLKSALYDIQIHLAESEDKEK